MTRELAACVSCDIPEAWAAALFEDGRHAGMRYQTRFSTGPTADAVALFDTAGQHDWPVDPHPIDGVQACGQTGITVAYRPTRRQLRIQRPPK